jgi:hypothetical protein
MLNVTKASGQLEEFSVDKVRASLLRAQADPKVIDKILLELKPKLYDKISTQEVYKIVYEFLSRYQKSHTIHYSLKPAIMALGPTGYPFEKFIAKLFSLMGYATQTQVTVAGECVSHEVDVVAEKEGLRYVMECKFHQRPGIKTEIKDALYVQARWEDINNKNPGEYAGIWLITNTRLTSEAIKYGNCKKMNLLAWLYPEGASLEDLVNQYGIHPLTCLPFLTEAEKRLLFSKGLVLCRDLKELSDKQLVDLGLGDGAIKNIRSALN